MNEQLWKLLQKARADAALRQKIWETRKDKDPALALCLLAEAEGFPVSVGELFAEGEEFCSNLRKSCNGGASEPIEGWQDGYDMFFASMEALEKETLSNN